ncbi:ComEC/Rec2 family competence protein [Bifidobacterium leontopitheci]|nr:ComEC/Rec2 family competence protein [Bifidobacterium leontopitheci]
MRRSDVHAIAMRMRPDGSREQGSRDFRMMPVALMVWAASLGAHGVWTMMMDIGERRPPAGGSALCDVIVPVMLAAAATAALYVLSRRAPGMATVTVSAMLLAAIAALAADTAQWQDAAVTLARQGSGHEVTVHARVTTPMMASSVRGHDCQADAVARTIRYATSNQNGRASIVVRSAAPVRLFASDGGCTALLQGATVNVTGELSQARYGGVPLWLAADDNGIAVERRQGLLRRTVHAMQQAFFMVTERLDDQGRILVPGLTLGMLGHEHVPANDGTVSDGTVSYGTVDAGASPEPVDDHYARNVEQRFKRSGIMHLMAVSGGHFALIAGMVRRLCARLLLPRRIVSCLMAVSQLGLSMLMVPSDSVLRALVMGLIGACAMFVGRRGQSVSALCWTVTLVLLADPAMARSYGFALSCAAVLGITLFSKPITQWLEGLLPGVIAEPLAMTASAQSLTLPIQVLMEPELPLASIPANLLVSPFVDVATLAGLAALLTSTVDGRLGLVFAWLSGCGTRAMDAVAAWLSSGRYAVVPWAGGVGGAALMLAAETMFAALTIAGTRLIRRRGMTHTARSGCTDIIASATGRPHDGAGHAADATTNGHNRLPGTPYRPRRRDRITLWIGETRRMFDKEE